MRPHDRDDHITKVTAATPSDTADCPRWLALLDTVMGGDQEMVAFLQRMAGYCLTGDTSEHALFFLYGTGANGKSVFLSVLSHVLGDYAVTTGMETINDAEGNRHPTELACLNGARLVTVSETEEGQPWAEARIKKLTGSDPVNARFMRQDEFEFIPQFKLLIAGNHKPTIKTVDIAIGRRLTLALFGVTIPPEQRDPHLTEKLKAEAPGILRWAIEGCAAWRAGGLAAPEVVSKATRNTSKPRTSSRSGWRSAASWMSTRRTRRQTSSSRGHLGPSRPGRRSARSGDFPTVSPAALELAVPHEIRPRILRLGRKPHSIVTRVTQVTDHPLIDVTRARVRAYG